MSAARRVLVTGATTPLGEAVVARLLAEPDVARVVAVGREPPGTAGARAPADARLSYARVDLRRSRELHNLIFGLGRALELDAVIHAAQHRRAADRGPSVRRLNVDATRELLRQLDRHPTIEQFVFRSHAEIYVASSRQPDILDEDQPLNLEPRAPQWVRDRVEADLVVCGRMGLAPYRIAVLRCAECVAPGCGSQLYDYLSSALCLRPLGFDPMLNLATVDDLARALVSAARSRVQGVYNIPGADTLPLSRAIAAAGRRAVVVPGPLLSPLYRWRRGVLGSDFRYDLNAARFHVNAILDGGRAARAFGYEPARRVDWEALRASLPLEREAARRLWRRVRPDHAREG